MAVEETDALARRIGELHAKLDATTATVGTTKNIARVLTVALIFSAVFGVYMLVSPFADAYNNPKPYKEALETDFRDRIRPTLEKEIKDSVQKTVPQVQQLISKKLTERYEEVTNALTMQTQVFLDEMKDFSEKELTSRIEKLNKSVHTRIVKEIPQLADEDIANLVVGNAQVAMERAVQRIVDEHLAVHMTTVSSIESELHSFPIPDHFKQMGNSQLSEELVSKMTIYSTNMLRSSLSANQKGFLQHLASDPNAPATENAPAATQPATEVKK